MDQNQVVSFIVIDAVWCVVVFYLIIKQFLIIPPSFLKTMERGEKEERCRRRRIGREKRKKNQKEARSV